MHFELDLSAESPERLAAMAAAGRRIAEMYQALKGAGSNLVARVLANQGTFYEDDHYPRGDVYDDVSKSQYYYHAHRRGSREHGHFHTFVRTGSLPEPVAPAPYAGTAPRPLGADAICHIVAVSMTRPGLPEALFTVNRWVTAETFYTAEDTIRIMERFSVNHVYPCLAVNWWLSDMLVLFRPQIAALLRERDAVIASWQRAHPDRDVYEDRMLEVTSALQIDVERQAEAVERASSSSAGG